MIAWCAFIEVGLGPFIEVGLGNNVASKPSSASPGAPPLIPLFSQELLATIATFVQCSPWSAVLNNV